MKQLELTPRLRAVAELIPVGTALADIGTDHAYLPVWLLRQGRIAHAIAADLREGPLDRAMQTTKEYECKENIVFRLCDGLSGIKPDEVDTIVIAGMGGETISAILQAAPWTKERRYTLILQPMSAQEELRRWLWQQGFDIQKEEIVREGEKLYNILVAKFRDTKPMSLGEEWAGRQWFGMNQPLRGEYLQRLIDKTKRAIDGISRGKDESRSERLEMLQQVKDALEDMKGAWDAWQQ